MSTVDYIFSIVIFHICMSLFESTLLCFCTPHSKLDLPTLHHGSRDRKNAIEQIKYMTLARIYIYILYVYICGICRAAKNCALPCSAAAIVMSLSHDNFYGYINVCTVSPKEIFKAVVTHLGPLRHTKLFRNHEENEVD